MNISASAPVNLSTLQLDNALALLEHAGALPTERQDSQTYLQSLIDALCDLSQHDPLTGLTNRRGLHAVLARELEIVARSGVPALLLMLDIDHFKPINDEHGHLAGDQVLQAVARCIEDCVRPQDTVARYGGEEFAIVLPGCETSCGQSIAERIRAAVSKLQVAVSPLRKIGLTLSVGGAFAATWVRSTPELWLERADMQLYLAKTQGRNRVCIDVQQDMPVSDEEKNLLFAHFGAGSAWSASDTARLS